MSDAAQVAGVVAAELGCGSSRVSPAVEALAQVLARRQLLVLVTASI